MFGFGFFIQILVCSSVIRFYGFFFGFLVFGFFFVIFVLPLFIFDFCSSVINF